jgi:hypothetical protein
MVHVSGISSGTGVGVGMVGGRLGVGVGRSATQTELSKRAAPPKMQTGQKGGLIAVGILALIIAFVVLFSSGANGLFLIFLFGGIVSIAWSQTTFIANWDKEASALHKGYSETFMCHACGHRFAPKGP